MINQINTMTLFERVLLHFDHLRLFDPFRPLPTRINKTAGKCRAVCEGVANKLMGRMSVDEVEEGENLVTHLFRASKGSHPEKTGSSNSNNSQEGVLRDGEIVGQITTALLAGHETTSTALSWVLMAVAKDKDLQQKLRDEINEQVLMGDLESMTPEQYDALPLLDNVTKETLRLYSPVHSTNREALEDDVIPLSKPIIDKNNRPVNALVVRKGQPIIIQIAAYNRSEEVWGPTAMDFNPDRWNDLPESVTDSKIPHGHLSFLAGARTCVGFRLAILEVSDALVQLKCGDICNTHTMTLLFSSKSSYPTSLLDSTLPSTHSKV
jgi:cytochrome P450